MIGIPKSTGHSVSLSFEKHTDNKNQSTEWSLSYYTSLPFLLLSVPPSLFLSFSIKQPRSQQMQNLISPGTHIDKRKQESFSWERHSCWQLWDPTAFSPYLVYDQFQSLHMHDVLKVSTTNDKDPGIAQSTLWAEVQFLPLLYFSAFVEWMPPMSPFSKIVMDSRRPGNANCN